MDLKKLGENLRKIRKENKLSQRQLCEDLNMFTKISQQQYSYYESGHTEPSLGTILALANRYEMSVEAVCIPKFDRNKKSRLTKAINAWISIKQPPRRGDEYNVVWVLDDGGPPVTTTMTYHAKLNEWRDTMGTNRVVSTEEIPFWRPLPNPIKP